MHNLFSTCTESRPLFLGKFLGKPSSWENRVTVRELQVALRTRLCAGPTEENKSRQGKTQKLMIWERREVPQTRTACADGRATRSESQKGSPDLLLGPSKWHPPGAAPLPTRRPLQFCLLSGSQGLPCMASPWAKLLICSLLCPKPSQPRERNSAAIHYIKSTPV